MTNVPRIWLDALGSHLGPASAALRFILRATEVGHEVLHPRDFVSVRDAAVLYVLAHAKDHSATANRIAAASAINSGAIGFIGDGLQCKGLVKLERGDRKATALKLTDAGEALVRKCRRC